MILDILKEPKTILGLVKLLNIGDSSVREHLWNLEKENKIRRIRKRKRAILWQTIK